jgi:hypothetical protein
VSELNSVVSRINTFGELRSMALVSHSRRRSVVLWVEKAIKRFYHTFISLKYSSPTIFTYLLHGVDSSREANWFSASQEIPRILWNPNVLYRVRKCPSPPIVSQLDAGHVPTSHFLKIHLNTIFPPTPGFSNWSLSLRFPHQNPVYIILYPYVLHAPPISFFSIWSPEQYWVRSTDH